MNRTLISTLLLMFFISAVNSQQVDNYSPKRLLIKLKSTVDSERFFGVTFDVEQEFNYRKLRSKVKTDIYFVDFVNDAPILEIIERFEGSSSIAFIEPDYVGYSGGNMMLEPNDPFYGSRQYALENDGSFSLMDATEDADIDIEKAWDFSTGCDDVVIAILDSGMKLDHPEMSTLIWNNTGESPNGLDTDGNGFADDLFGWDFANEDNDPTDDYGHGTNVSGIVSAIGDNGIGYAGINWSSPSMQLKVINDQNFGFYSWWTEAIYYAIDSGADVINMSLGGNTYSAVLHDAIKYAYENDVAVVACMMNVDSETKFYPAAFAESIVVGATDAEDNRVSPFFWSNTSGSNYGEHLDLVAPGNYIYGLSFFSNSNFNSYWGGTSQSTPLVAGTVSLMYCMSGSYGGIVDDVRQTIQATADDQVGDSSEDIPGYDKFYGYGRLNAGDALESWSTIISNINSNPYSMEITPNPSFGGFVEISWDLPKVTELIIYSVEGRIAREFKLESSTSQVISDLPAGTYIAKIASTQSVLSKKLIVQ